MTKHLLTNLPQAQWVNPHGYDLSPAQLERFHKLTEELGEALAAMGKLLLHGMMSTGPDSMVSNKKWLEREIGDILAAIELLTNAGDLSISSIDAARVDKRRKITRYMKHQHELLPAPSSSARSRKKHP